MKIFLTDPTSHQENGQIHNLGDIIIKQAIENHLSEAISFRWVDLDREKLPPDSLLILAGANILANNPFFNPSVWRPPMTDYLRRHYVLLFGTGWWQYQDGINAFSRLFYRRSLVDGSLLHSVRDAYTAQMLASCGVRNVLNTGCPTMWGLRDTYRFPEKAKAVVFTLTDYARHPTSDLELVRLLLDEYPAVYFFPQGSADMQYLSELVPDRSRITPLERSLDAYDQLLQREPIDYVGTRLHGGIRAMQAGRRAFVVSVDNRATEISRDSGLAVVERDQLPLLRQRINTEFDSRLRLDRDTVRQFKESLKRFVVERKN